MIYEYIEPRAKLGPFPELFSYKIEVPDEYGAALHAHRVRRTIRIICENGVHLHEIKKRDPQVMMNKGKHAKLLHVLRKKGVRPVGVAYYK